MPDYVRNFVPGGTFFFTVAVHQRRNILTQATGIEGSRTVSRRKRQERGIWQRRYWEHTIDDEVDFERHVEYIHYNAVKHGLVQCPKDWPHSSFHRFVENGIYDEDWGCALNGELCFDDLDETAME